MKTKPGYKTSEFWFTLVSFIFSGLFLLGFIGDPSQKDDLIRDVSHGVESVILIGGQLLILYNYIGTRKIAKENSVNLPEPISDNKESTPDDKPKPKPKPKRKPRKPRSSTKSNKQRSSKTRNRKTDNGDKKLG